jgi:D-arginine dehydrogenase
VKYDYVVIGGGIAGASVAARLAEYSSVLILEMERGPGYHSTGRSAALYSALYGNEAVRAITRASRKFFENPPHGFSEHPLLTPRGVIFAGADQDRDAIEELCALPLAKRLSTQEALQMVPVLNPEAAVHCALEAEAYDVDVHGLHQGFLRMAKSCGARLICSAEVTALYRKIGFWAVQSSAGAFEAGVVINAAGAWADRVAGLAGAKPLGIQPLRRTAMIIDSPSPGSSRWPAVFAGDDSFYFKPDAGMILASLADESLSEPCDAQPEELDIAICADRIESRTKMQVKRVVRSWAGLRSFAPDRTPVVGFDPVQKGFFWLAGQGGYGVQTAPALSEIAAALVRCTTIPSQIIDEGLRSNELTPSRLSL